MTGSAPPGAIHPVPPPPSVSVIIPTKDRSGFLPELMAGLLAQCGVELEVVLVDDGSSDDTPEVVRELVGDDPRFTLISIENRGPATARNVGAAAATGEWLVFTDDDCLPKPGWLAELVRVAVDSGAEVVQGRTAPDDRLPRREHPWFVRTLNLSSWSGRFQTCNLLVRAERFRAVGGFNESFPLPVGEDTDLGLRLVDDGAPTAFAPRAIVHHRMLPMTVLEFIRRRYFWGNVVQLVALNPRGRSIFPHRHVAYRGHVGIWVSLPIAAWLLAQRRWGVPAVALTGYSAYRARRTRHKGRSIPVRMAWGCVELVGEGAGAVGFLVNSIRHRRLLL